MPASIDQVAAIVPNRVRALLAGVEPAVVAELEEIRLRLGRPVMLVTPRGDLYLARSGGVSADPGEAYIFSRDDAGKTLQLMCSGSVYAVEEELRNGYLTLPGGHRVGITGRAVLEGGRVKTQRDVTGFCIRISRQVIGAADKVMPHCVQRGARGRERFLHTLIISPPRCGKTTLLRDMIRQLSNGFRIPDGSGGAGGASSASSASGTSGAGSSIRGFKVAVVDERSEIAACYQGEPQNDMGVRTDVLDSCPKAEGIMMLIRAMSPDVIATDELGRAEDAESIEEAVNAGVSILATAHGSSLEELARRPTLNKLLGWKAFERLIFLGQTLGPGTVERIVDGISGAVILNGPVR
ncbi:MAG: stage III sporulation protein AA [Firmicutes bacterium]|nr:stage III sporulation protein AA [Bacillota bacterium]